MAEQMFFLPVSKEEMQNLIRTAVRAEMGTDAPKEKQNDKYLTRSEVCKLFDITLPTLRKRTLDGTIRGYRIGRRVLYKQIEISKALTAIR
jgi:excisionase family DNA binding protein